MLQPLRHWFTLIYRKCEHLAVWVIGARSYWLSWALPFGIASPLTTFILYHKLFSLSIPFLRFFLVVGVGIEPHIHLLLSRCPTIERPNHFCQVLYFSEKILGENLVVLSFPSLNTLIVSHFKEFVKREFFFLRTFFTRCTSSPILVSLVGTFLLTFLLYHTLRGLSRGFLLFFENLTRWLR